MTSEPKSESQIAQDDGQTGKTDPNGAGQKAGLLPGVVAIAVYLLLVALENIVSVVQSRAHSIDLIFSVALIAAALGLLRLLRWAWALTLAAVVFRSGILCWQYASQHSGYLLLLALLNLVFFFYLVRAEVRVRLR